jgi:MFS family permease
MPLVGGFFVDMVGFRKMTVFTVSLAALGQLGFTISSELKLWPGMWASRALFGIGTESLCVAQRILVAEWFMGRELALSMGVVLAFGRLGSTINDNISALFGYCVNAYWAGFGLCMLSVLSAVMVTWIDRSHEHSVQAKVTEKQWAAFQKSRQLRPRTRLSDICKLGLPFWLCCGMVLFCFPPVSSFNNISSQLITARWQQLGQEVSVQQVNAVVGILYAVSAVLALGMGWLVDRAGTRTMFVCAGALVVATAHVLIGQTTLPVAVPLVGIGLGFSSLAAAVWPEIAFVTPRQSFGIAYGVAGAVQNSGLASVPAIVSQLQPPACSGSYSCVEDLFSCIAVVGACIAAWAAILECQRNRMKKEAKAAGDAEALLQGIEEDKGWESGSQGSSASEDEVLPLVGGAGKAGASPFPTPPYQRAQSHETGSRDGRFRTRDKSAPVRGGAPLGVAAGGPRGTRVQSANEAGAAGVAAAGRGHRRRATVAGQQGESMQSLGAFLEHSTHDLRARSASTSHDMDPAGAAAAAGGSDRETSAGTESLSGMRPNTPEMVSAAIWGYAADVTQHGARLAERHYRRSATQGSRRGSRRGSQQSSSDYHEDAAVPLPTNFP